MAGPLPFSLDGQRILVTGASSGIGRATARVLSQLGAQVILTGRDEARLAEARGSLTGDGHVMAPFDLSKVDEIPAWVKTLAAQGPLSGVVHAAGKQLTQPLRMTSGADWDSIMRTNLYSAAMLARGFGQKGCSTPGGGIVLISSIMGQVSRPALAAYSASKAALGGLARSLALEMARDRVRVNCIAPAFVETEMLAQLRERLPAASFEELEKAHPLGFGQPEDVAYAAAFLLSPASRWITGTVLVADGGYSIQ